MQTIHDLSSIGQLFLFLALAILIGLLFEYRRSHMKGRKGSTIHANGLQDKMANINEDQAILKQYPWQSYKITPPAFQELVECALLKAVLQHLCGSSADAGTYDTWSKHLRSDPDFCNDFLRCWEAGSFQALRLNNTFRSITGLQGSPGGGKYHGAFCQEGTTVTQSETSPPEEHVAAMPWANEEQGCVVSPPELGSAETKSNQAHLPKDGALTKPEGGVVMVCNSHLTDVAGDYHHNVYLNGEETKLLTWLSIVDHWRIHREILKRRAKGTCNWFFESAGYGRWVEDDSQSILWCPGIPGVGKTIIASAVIDHLQHLHSNSALTAVCFVYFNYRNQKEYSLEYVLSTLSRQIHETCRLANMESGFEVLYAKNPNMQPTDEELQLTLSTIIPRFKRCFVVLDALDEYLEQYSDHQALLLLNTIISLGSSVKLLVTSRTLGNMVYMFKDLGAVKEPVIADSRDLATYLQTRIPDLPFQPSESLASEIMTKVQDAAKGRFLMAGLHMNALKDHLNVGELREALDRLPDQVDETYTQIMEHIAALSEARKRLALKALMWIACSTRPLKADELQHALVTKLGIPQLNYITPLPTILSVCMGLVIVENEFVGFVHFTAQQYFMKEKTRYFPDADQEITKTCLAYLLWEELHTATFDYLRDKNTFLMVGINFLPCNFYDYAAVNWGHHQSRCNHLDSLDVLSPIDENGNLALNTWLYYIFIELQWHDDAPEGDGTGIFLAVFHHQIPTLSALLRNCTNTPFTRQGRSPLSLAAQIGEIQALEVILRWSMEKMHTTSVADLNGPGQFDVRPDPHEDDIANIPDTHGRTPLSYAAKYGWTDAVKLLLQHKDIIVDSPDNDGNTPFMHARGHISVMRQLLDHEGVNVNSRDNNGSSSLSSAVRFGSDCEIQLLLQQTSIEVDLPDNNGCTPLMHAAARGRISVICQLLEHGGVNVNARDNKGWTPLTFAVYCGHDPAIQLLLQQEGIQVDFPDSVGRTPLIHAAERGRISVVRQLLRHGGVNVNARDNDGWTSLSLASSRRNDPVTQLLLQQEVGHQKSGPVVRAAQSELVSVTQQPDDHVGVGINMNRGGNEIWALLTIAVQDGYPSFVRVLLQMSGRDPGEDMPPQSARVFHELIMKLSLENGYLSWNFRDERNNTPLSLAAHLDSTSTIRLLLQHSGIDPDPKNDHGTTPLLIAAERGFEHIVRMLLEHGGVDVNAMDNDGDTPLSSAAWNCRTGVVKLLLEHPEVDVNPHDCKGRTPLSRAVDHETTPHLNLLKKAESDAYSTVELLLTRDDIQVNLTDNEGLTPLYYAKESEFLTIVDLLRSRGAI